MNIQIFLEGRELELTQDISLPITKSYESLTNPTNILVEHSKAVNIPMTARNNQILGFAYRLDKTVIAGKENIGLYLDCTQKIPMQIFHNGSLLMDGYAKYENATSTKSNSYYTLTLYGKLGDIFQKLLGVVVSSEYLTDEQKAEPDGGLKYVLNDNLPGEKLDKDYVLRSWNNDKNKSWKPNPDASPEEQIDSTDIIGFAPAYRGRYQDFDSKSIEYEREAEGEPGKLIKVIKPMSEYLDAIWYKVCYDHYKSVGLSDNDAKARAQSYVDGLNTDELIDAGFTDNQMREYRSYAMKPYIYVNQLFYMFMDKCKELTGYDIELDASWFNINNPYWVRLCYFLDFLENAGIENRAKTELAKPQEVPTNLIENNPELRHVQYELFQRMEDTHLKAEVEATLVPSEIILKGSRRYDNNYYIKGLDLDRNTTINITIEVYDGLYDSRNLLTTKKFWYCPEGVYGDNYNINNPEYDVSNFLTPSTTHEGDDVNEYVINTFNIPEIRLSQPKGLQGNLMMRVLVDMYNDTAKNGTTGIYLFSQDIYDPSRYKPTHYEEMVMPINDIKKFSMTQSGVEVNDSWKKNSRVLLSELYYKDEPLFNVILNYTKMFNLQWDIDYYNQKIWILTKKTYFDRYKIQDWNNKLDRNKDYKITPVVFPTKYVKFNYEDTEGFRYTGYKERFGYNLGEKILTTTYNFDSETKELFENIQPSSVSSKTYLTWDSLLKWQYAQLLEKTQDDKVLIDAENEDEAAAISVYNFYLRGENQKLDYTVMITDDSPLMIKEDKFCYMELAYAQKYGYDASTRIFPTFNIAMFDNRYFEAYPGRAFGCIFNQPNEDYTATKWPTKAKGNYIYDLFWKNYLNERYNPQNKKVLGYFRLSPKDFVDFKFNNFVELDNQLFVVNKIFDYDISNLDSTKVELIQITNPEAYVESNLIFPAVVMNPVYIKATPEDYPADKATVTVRIHTTEELGQHYFSNIEKPEHFTGFSEISLIKKPDYVDYTCEFRGLGAVNGIFKAQFCVRVGEETYCIPFVVDFSEWQAPKQYAIYPNPESINISPDTSEGIVQSIFVSQDKVNSVKIETPNVYSGTVKAVSQRTTYDRTTREYTTAVDFKYSGLDVNNEKWQGNIYASNSKVSVIVPTVIDYTNYGKVWKVYFDYDGECRFDGAKTVKDGEMYTCTVTPINGYKIYSSVVYDGEGNELPYTITDDGILVVENVHSDVHIYVDLRL